MQNETWNKSSWKNFKAQQQPNYPDLAQADAVLKNIGLMPPLVFSGEVEKLKAEIADASAGKRFILQGGDCAERFIDCNSQTILNKLKILLQMSVLLTYAARTPVIRIGRIAGQYAKPRSNDTENVGGVELPSYRGDIVNGYDATPESRAPDPMRLLESYFRSATTLNYIRAAVDGGFADLHHPGNWDMNAIEKTAKWADYEDVVHRILDAIEFMESFGGIRAEELGRIEFYTSHEGLLLGYEDALTRKSPLTGKYYNLGAHMIWIGERTRQLDGAHIEYFRGIENPIGVKVGPSTTPDELLKLIDALDPRNEPGRLTIITRMGVEKIADKLPPLAEAVKRDGRNVAWSCDPMHGNTIKADGGIKTRAFESILEEIRLSFHIHKQAGGHLAGVHFELTGDDVTECIGGAMDIKGHELHENYETYCDPRLNYAQSLEMAFLIVKLLRE